MVETGAHDRWFDDTTTPDRVEGKREILIRAALETRKTLSDRLGKNPDKWQWGLVHQQTFVSPIRRKGVGHGLLGGGTHQAPGSVETLYRGLYAYNCPYDVAVSAALRMVADLGDEDKVMAIIPGGVAGRIFHPHTTDQIRDYMMGTKAYWWFSDRAVSAHTQRMMTLTPGGGHRAGADAAGTSD